MTLPKRDRESFNEPGTTFPGLEETAMSRRCLSVAIIALTILGIFVRAEASDYGSRLGTPQRGGETFYFPRGPGVLFGALDPAVRRWYVPQELFTEYAWKQWDYSNYAREPYQRYVDIALEGDYFYDLYGNYVTHGWLIFTTSQSQPEQFGSAVFKAGRFGGWFNRLLISADAKGQHQYALMISNELRTTLTPMTFSKPRWDGVQFDWASDKIETTIIYSRVSSPGGSSTDDKARRLSNATSMYGGRVEVQVGDFATLGFTSVNSHQSNTLHDGFVGNPFSGELTIDQNNTLSFIQIELRDDSPADDAGGAAYFPAGSDIVITYNRRDEEGRKIRDEGKRIGFEPIVEGGFIEEGFLSADGSEVIRLKYDFNSSTFVNRASAAKEDIEKVEFKLVLGNDYQVWMTSSQQLTSSSGVVPLLVTRAEGNVQDNTNLRVVHFEYGLPTATQILGTTLELNEVFGFDFYGEYDVSYSFTKYPNLGKANHSTSSGIAGARFAPAWMMNLSRVSYPHFVFGEAYSINPRYNTRTFVTAYDGFIDYENERLHVVELVEDNDDQDRFPDTIRKDWLGGDTEVFPGWDENNDFISDFNQNDNQTIANSVPDYEEAFLRHNVDRPEFLFGIDMNNNLWIDRFENDEDPDYPYGKDHEGYNLYAGTHLTPDIRLTAGVLREELISSNQKNHTNYLLFTMDRDVPEWGRFRLFDMIKSVEDNIADDLLQWTPDTNLRTGDLTAVVDPLVAPDTWINTFWFGHDYHQGGLRMSNYLKWDYYNQRKDKQELTLLDLGKLEEEDYFFGLIDKASFRFQVGSVWIEPRWKSEYRLQTLDLVKGNTEKRKELAQIGGAIAGLPLLSHTTVQGGIEFSYVNDLEGDADENGIHAAVQFTNVSDYLGYKLTGQVGLKIDHTNRKGREAFTVTKNFVAVYAGLE